MVSKENLCRAEHRGLEGSWHETNMPVVILYKLLRTGRYFQDCIINTSCDSTDVPMTELNLVPYCT